MTVNRQLQTPKVLWLKKVLLLLYAVDNTSTHQLTIMMMRVSMLDNTESDSTTAHVTLLPSWPSKCRTMKTSLPSENGTQRRRWCHTDRQQMVTRTLPVETQSAAAFACWSTAVSTLCLRKLSILPEMVRLKLLNTSMSKRVCQEAQENASAGWEFSFASLDTTCSLPPSSTF